ncbi:hypothetical protein [Enterococcus sp. AZ072]
MNQKLKQTLRSRIEHVAKKHPKKQEGICSLFAYEPKNPLKFIREKDK